MELQASEDSGDISLWLTTNSVFVFWWDAFDSLVYLFIIGLEEIKNTLV
jgi:hypothetical protein